MQLQGKSYRIRIRAVLFVITCMFCALVRELEMKEAWDYRLDRSDPPEGGEKPGAYRGVSRQGYMETMVQNG
jgi:hypothetical protein